MTSDPAAAPSTPPPEPPGVGVASATSMETAWPGAERRTRERGAHPPRVGPTPS